MSKVISLFFRGGYKILFSYPRIIKYSRNKDKYPIEERYKFVRKLANIIIKAFNVEINVENLQYLNGEGGHLITPNHQSLLDSLVLICAVEKPIVFLSKIEVKDYPIIGKVTHIIDTLFLDRKNLKDSVKVLKKCQDYLENNKNVVIFPEGTRSNDENYSVGSFKAGSFKPVIDAKKTIVPTLINGSYKPLYKKYKQKKYEVKIVFLPTYKYEEYQQKTSVEIASEVENRVKELYLKSM